MRGRKPIPTELKKLAGNPGHRPINDLEPKPKRDLPRCPSHLDKTAKAMWRKLSKELHVLGVLTNIDTELLSAYCQVYSRWKNAELMLQKSGEVIKTTNGNLIQNPYLAIANRAIEQMAKLASEFGMTPSSRSRIKINEPEELDELDKLQSLFGQNVRVSKNA